MALSPGTMKTTGRRNLRKATASAAAPGMPGGAPIPWAARLCELELRLTQLESENRKLREAHRQLEDAGASAAQLHDLAPCGLVTLDLQGTILDLNRTTATLLGRKRARLLRRPFALVVAADDLPRFLSHLRRCRRAQSVVSTELSLRGSVGPVL